MNFMMKRLFGYGLAVLLCFVVLGCTKQDAKQGAMPDAAFIELCKRGTAEEVRRVLASGANVNARDKKGITALMCAAAFHSNPEVVKALLAGGADINARENDGTTALMLAAGFSSNPEVVKALLTGGADALAADKYGHDALWHAQNNRAKEKEKIIQILKEYASSGR